jgi:hypothetical protein
MLDQDAEQAAFLTNAGEAPRVGEQLELTNPSTAHVAADGAPGGHAANLPRYGRVVRLDDPQGVTRRVAIQFE